MAENVTETAARLRQETTKRKPRKTKRVEIEKEVMELVKKKLLSDKRFWEELEGDLNIGIQVSPKANSTDEKVAA